MKVHSVELLTKNFIKDFVQSRNIGDFSLVHSDVFIKNPHLLKKKKTIAVILKSRVDNTLVAVTIKIFCSQNNKEYAKEKIIDRTQLCGSLLAVIDSQID